MIGFSHCFFSRIRLNHAPKPFCDRISTASPGYRSHIHYHNHERGFRVIKESFRRNKKHIGSEFIKLGGQLRLRGIIKKTKWSTLNESDFGKRRVCFA